MNIYYYITKSYLQKFNFIKTKHLFNYNCIRIWTPRVFRLLLSESEDIFKTIQCNLDNFAVHDGEEVTQRGDAALVHQESEQSLKVFGKSECCCPPDLFCSPSTGGVSDGPGGLLPSFKLGFGLDLDEDRENVGVYHGLYLLPVTGCDI